ncbi:MAG: hypothetical protein ACK5MV_02745 [Aminipila sp.]
MQNAIKYLVEGIIYIIFILGISLIYYHKIKTNIAKIRARHRLRERKRRMEHGNKLYDHINYITKTTLNLPAGYLINISVAINITVLFIGIRNLTFVSALIISTSIAATPYMILRVRFEGIRRKGSFEGEYLISNFLNQYRISNFNVYEALEMLLEESKNTKVTNSLILKMLLELRGTGNINEIKKATEKFSSVINTNWSRMFAYNIQLAASKGINISLAVEDILIQLREARVIYEERKRLNSESMRIVVYMIPILYLFTIIMSVKYIGTSVLHYLQNQFLTKEGFMLLMISFIMFMMNIAIIEIVGRKKFDY